MLSIDYFGPVKMLEFTKKCKKDVVFNHVSTAYVNSNKPTGSLILEKVYDWTGSMDFEQTVDKIMKMEPETLAKCRDDFLNEVNYMNTYVYAKSLAERYLARHRGNVRLVISRPAMVTASLKEPFVGWTDTTSAIGLAMFPAITGLQRNVYMKHNATDCVPVDQVSNAILVASAASA